MQAPSPVTPVAVNLSLMTGQMPRDMAKDVELPPRVMAAADQIGKQQLLPLHSLQVTLSHYVARMLIPHIPRWITPEERMRQEFVKHLVTKPDGSHNASDKPKDQ